MPEAQSSQEEELKEILASPLLERAYALARQALGQKVRQSGDSYLEHVIRTTLTLRRWHQSETVLAAGLLHSTIGSGSATITDLKREFGPEIANLVEKTRAITNTHYSGLARHAEELRRFLVAIAKDVRILLIAFAHRLDTMRHLSDRPIEQQLSIARETLEIYAPLANRLGMGKLKADFETLSFPFAHPKEYALTAKLLNPIQKKLLERLQKIYRALRADFAREKLPIVESDYRLKNVYSLYKKLSRPEYKFDISKVNDLIALRLVTDTVENCYRALGIIHGKYKPVAGKIKDYIANPKPNSYRSLHTTIYTGDPARGADGGLAEVQIRTKEMHDEAEYGVVARLAYEESGKPDTGGVWAKHLSWVRELLSLAKQKKNPGEFTEAVKLDYFRNQIFVFTPDGDVVELPEGATPIDFAYAVHSELGEHAHAAKINGKHLALDTILQGGETVLIETSKNAKPAAKWLDSAKSTEARKKIRAYLARKS